MNNILLNKLPTDLLNKILYYISHPISNIIFNHFQIFNNNIEYFIWIKCTKIYKKKINNI